MGQSIEQLRHVCALGALQSVLAIPRAVPILHAGPGCGQKLWGALAEFNGSQGSGYVGGHCVPCTNMAERDVVFGGEERLRAEISNALRVMDADLFVVLTGCTADIIGDDVAGIVREFQEAGEPVVFAETGGFKGTNYLGHERILTAIIEQHLQDVAPPPRQTGVVNLWSVVPYQDTLWSGNLEALTSLLTDLGLHVNNIFGHDGGIQAIDRIPAAELNLLVSPWVGLNTVQLLQARFGTPFLHYPVLPIGPSETGAFLRAVAAQLGIDAPRVEPYIREQEARYYYYMERCGDFIFESRSGMPTRFVTISDSVYALGIARFLINDLGLLPEAQFIVDDVPDAHQPAITALFQDVVEGIRTPVTFVTDGGEIGDAIRNLHFHSRPFIIGSTWDRVIAREINGFPLSVSLPVSDRLILSRTYVGYEGALRLAEDLYSVLLGEYQ